MATRPRTPTFRNQPSARRVYETLQPSSDMKETPEAVLLHVYLPGFTRDQLKITFVGSSRVVRITGERLIQGNRWSRFDKTYPVPEYCQAEALQGKFDMGTLVLTMPKKSTSQAQVAEENTQKPQGEAISPHSSKSSTKLVEQDGDKKRTSLPSSMKGPSELNSKKVTPEDTISSQRPTQKGSKTMNPPETFRDRSPQNSDQELINLKRPPPAAAAAAVTVKPRKGQEELEEIQKEDAKAPKREEEVKQKSALTVAARDQAEEKREDEIKLKERLAALKNQLQEKTEVWKERTSSDVKEEEGKSSESRKPAINTTEKKGIFQEKEIRTRKVMSPPKVHQEKEKESASENVIEILGNGIREVASSASHVVTRIMEGNLNDEEKYLAANMGAAVLVIAALGAYVSYKFA